VTIKSIALIVIAVGVAVVWLVSRGDGGWLVSTGAGGRLDTRGGDGGWSNARVGDGG
jgi:hypothetical protein